ncbi:calcineurin-like phosphoesterase C-terminal domain-containing protein [Penaeicola halotolerans]|uniref:calcineurin-like phosphoesterase C-terminal domain-containing protein n=1 Tax=Penaeicola halotolerans TaxID=2793196 RepID=UPI001CF876F9|nr:calcineurin-like phosphoesterase C-terminal domain-containing protein [Penaeicola halotolerans]
MKNFYLSILMLCCVGTSWAQMTVTGYVYEDLNGNFKKERREKGVAKVSVTNGIDVVQTDASGRYTLPIKDDQIIAVIKPSGYELPKNDLNLPQFYYIHKPAGSPELYYKGVAPTGDLPKELNFALTPVQEDMNFTALVFGDPQPYSLMEVEFFEKGVVNEVIGVQNVKFGMSLGDLVGDDLTLLKPYQNVIAKIGVPWYNVMGNHDQNYDVEEDIYADETFEAHFGPSNYAFNYGKVHFIVLDDILYPDPRGRMGYWAGFREDQLAFIKNDLALVPKDHLIVLAFHIPLFDEGFGDTFRDSDREALFDILKDFPHTLSLSAHTHLQRHDFFYEEAGWQQREPHHHYNVGTTSGDWYKGKNNEKGIPVSRMRDGTPKGYAYIDFNGNQYELRYKVVDQSPEYQMEIFAPKVVEKDKRTTAGIFVNFFIGNEKSTLRYRIDGGEWQDMRYMEDYDPIYLLEMFEWDTTEELIDGKRPSNPQRSKHLWRANVPNNLSEGQHTIEIEAIDMFGKRYTGISSYEIKAVK